MAVAGYAESNQRHSLICYRVKAKSEVQDDCSYRIFCAGGIKKQDPWNEKDNEPHLIMVFFRDYIGKMINIPSVKGIE